MNNTNKEACNNTSDWPISRNNETTPVAAIFPSPLPPPRSPPPPPRPLPLMPISHHEGKNITSVNFLQWTWIMLPIRTQSTPPLNPTLPLPLLLILPFHPLVWQSQNLYINWENEIVISPPDPSAPKNLKKEKNTTADKITFYCPPHK